SAERSIRVDRHRRRRAARATGHGARALKKHEAKGRRLRRAWRRPRFDPLLPFVQSRLRVVLALPRPGGAARGRAGRAGATSVRGMNGRARAVLIVAGSAWGMAVGIAIATLW